MTSPATDLSVDYSNSEVEIDETEVQAESLYTKGWTAYLEGNISTALEWFNQVMLKILGRDYKNLILSRR